MRYSSLLRFSACAVFGTFGIASAGDIKSSDWAWNIDDPETVYAATSNSAENMFAQFCYTEAGNCVYVVAFGSTCTEGNQYPALVNTDTGSRSIELTCGRKFSDENLLIISDFDLIDDLVRKGSRIGIVMPMQGDEFKAVRFSLKGAVKALDLMRLAAEKLHAGNSDSPKARPAVERL